VIVFYSENLIDNRGELEAEDAKHCYKVLRKKEGDYITVMNGIGSVCNCQIISISKNNVQFRVTESAVHEKSAYEPTIGISLLRTSSRLEWFLEKATEIGVNTIIPFHSARTVKGKFRIERAQNIVISAIKQSLRPWKPDVQSDQKLRDIIQNVQSKQKYICHYSEENPHLYDSLKVGEESFILIGPEGDFTDEELALAKEYGWLEVNIGKSRLRAETAGITAVQIVAMKNR